MHTETDLLAVKDRRRFQVHCDAGTAGKFAVGTDSLSVVIGQRVRVGTQEEMWDSVHVICKEHDDGSLTVEVRICNPNWAETRKIAIVRSNPGDTGNADALTFDLKPRNA